MTSHRKFECENPLGSFTRLLLGLLGEVGAGEGGVVQVDPMIALPTVSGPVGDKLLNMGQCGVM